eukprot:scaffold2844_cov326-Pavlova_lutheri.AAC.13
MTRESGTVPVLAPDAPGEATRGASAMSHPEVVSSILTGRSVGGGIKTLVVESWIHARTSVSPLFFPSYLFGLEECTSMIASLLPSFLSETLGMSITEPIGSFKNPAKQRKHVSDLQWRVTIATSSTAILGSCICRRIKHAYTVSTQTFKVSAS